MSVRRHARLREVLPDRIELVPAGGIVEAQRAVKDAGESRASPPPPSWPTTSTGCCASRGSSGAPSARWRSRSRHEMRRRGAEPELPVDRRLRPSAARCRTPCRPTCAIPRDTLVTLDIGARLDGYCSDCTRTWATGELPGRPGGGLRAGPARPGGGAGRRAARPEGREIDAVARDIIEAAGHGEHFGHGLGHGVGLEVHEAPRLARTRRRAARRRQRRDGRARRLPAGARRRPHRGSRGRHRGRPRGALGYHQGPHCSSTRAPNPLKPSAR